MKQRSSVGQPPPSKVLELLPSPRKSDLGNVWWPHLSISLINIFLKPFSDVFTLKILPFFKRRKWVSAFIAPYVCWWWKWLSLSISLFLNFPIQKSTLLGELGKKVARKRWMPIFLHTKIDGGGQFYRMHWYTFPEKAFLTYRHTKFYPRTQTSTPTGGKQASPSHAPCRYWYID